MNIYVGNLNWSVTSEDLENLFSPYGEISSAKIITDKFKNDRSKGFGFVEMNDDEAARNAISGLNDTEVGGRRIIVNESAPKTDKPGGGGGYKKKPYGGGGGGYNRGGSGGGGGYNRGGGGGYSRGNDGGNKYGY